MTEFQRYLAEEIAEDHADGLVSRREALRRLGLLGLTRSGGRVAARGGAWPSGAKALTGGESGSASAAAAAAQAAARPDPRDHVPRAAAADA